MQKFFLHKFQVNPTSLGTDQISLATKTFTETREQSDVDHHDSDGIIPKSMSCTINELGTQTKTSTREESDVDEETNYSFISQDDNLLALGTQTMTKTRENSDVD